MDSMYVPCDSEAMLDELDWYTCESSSAEPVLPSAPSSSSSAAHTCSIMRETDFLGGDIVTSATDGYGRDSSIMSAAACGELCLGQFVPPCRLLID